MPESCGICSTKLVRRRDRLRRSLEAVRLKLHQESRREHETALRTLERIVAEHFPAVNCSGYIYSLTKTADVTEHHLRLAGFDTESPPNEAQRADRNRLYATNFRLFSSVRHVDDKSNAAHLPECPRSR